MARQGYGRHNVIATGPNDTGKQVSVNVWNQDLKDYGLLGFTSIEYTIDGSGVVDIDTTATDNEGQSSVLIVESAGGSSVDDDLDQITTAMTNPYDLLYVFAKGTGNTITVRDNTGSGAGKIQVLSTTTLSTTTPLILIRVGTAGGATAGDDWIQYGGGGSVSANDLTGTVLKSTVVTSSLTDVGALDEGSITSGFGTIDTGSSAISTTGTVTTGGLTIGGDIGTAAAQDWDLIDNTADALSFDSTGKAGILKFVTTDSSEGVTMSGTLGVTGTITGTLSGSATSATTATNATNVGLTNEATDVETFVLFTAAATGNENALTNTGLTFNSNTANLTTTTFTGALAGNATTASNATLAAGLSAQLVVASGGTNLTSYAVGDVLYASGTTAISKLAKPGTPAGEVLTFAVGASAPSWAAGGGGAHTEQEWTVYDPASFTPTPAVANTEAYMYTEEIDSDNDGLFIQMWKNGASQAVQIA